MKVIKIHEYGGPEVMKIEDAEPASPAVGEVLVRVAAAGVNFKDIFHRRGLYKVVLPSGLGYEGAGVVELTGPGTTDIKRGDRIAWAGVLGSYATHVIVPAWNRVFLPKEFSFHEGAAIMTQGLTAHFLVHSVCSIKSGDVCLVHAAAGGTARLICQMLKMLGARVIGTVSSEFKAEVAMEAGADEIIIYTQKKFEEEVKRLTEGKGVNVVFDSVGKDTFEKSLECLAPRGCMILYSQSSGMAPFVDPDALREKSLFLTRPSARHYINTREDFLRRSNDLFGWLKNGKLRLRIDRTYPMEDAALAHDFLESRQSAGKILLIP